MQLEVVLKEVGTALSKLGEEKKPVTFREFALAYADQKVMSPAYREATKRSFAHHTRFHLVPAFGDLPLGEVNNRAWLAWVNETRKSGRITRFFNARKTLTEILLAARDAGHIERKPKLDNPDAPKNVGRVLEDAEILRILRHTLDDQFRLIFYAFWKTGCRPREVLKWEWSMIKWNEPGKTWIEIPAAISKCKRSRPMPMNPGLSRRLHSEWKRGPSSKYVFPSRSNPSKPQLSYHGAFYTACYYAGVKDAVPYDFRRTFITRCAARNMPLLYVAKVLDTSVKMIEAHYAKASASVMQEIVQ